ncbi:MAG: serine hydrolase domain-containing protein [Pseudomonadales bacterium]
MDEFTTSIEASLELIDKWIAFQRYYKQLPSISVGIAQGGNTLFEKSYGMADMEKRTAAAPTTLYRIASHSKLFTTSAIMRLYEDSKLRLDDLIVDHLEWFASGSNPDQAEMTIRQLLSHSSGMNRDGDTDHWFNDEFPDLDNLKRQCQAGIRMFDANVNWKYSNMAFSLLGHLIAAVTDKDYEAAVSELVIEPMELDHTMPDFTEASLAEHAIGYNPVLPGEIREPLDHVHARAMNAATGFSSCVPDLLRFYHLHQLDSGKFLLDASKREMQRQQFSKGPIQWGLGFELGSKDDVNFIGHSGVYPGFLSRSGFDPGNNLTIVVLTNSSDSMPGLLYEGISSIIHYVHKQRAKLKGGKGHHILLDELSGYYRTRWGISGIQRIGDGAIKFMPAYPDPKETFTCLDYVGKQTFRDADGRNIGDETQLKRNSTGDWSIKGYGDTFVIPDW